MVLYWVNVGPKCLHITKKVQIWSEVTDASRTHGLTHRLCKTFRQKVSSSFLAKESPINLGWVQAGVVIVYLLRTNSSPCVFSRVPEVSWKVQFHHCLGGRLVHLNIPSDNLPLRSLHIQCSNHTSYSKKHLSTSTSRYFRKI